MTMLELRKNKSPGHLLTAIFGGLLLLSSTPGLAAGLEDVILSNDGRVTTVSVVDGPQSRLILHLGDEALNIPGSGQAEAVPLGLLRSRTDEIHVFWTASDNDGLTLQLSSLNGGAWDGPHTLLAGGEPVVFAEVPFLFVDADRFTMSFEEDSLDLERQIVHVAWREQGLGLRYSAFVLRNGHYVGWNEIVTVTSAFRNAHADTEPTNMSDHLGQLMSVASGPQGGVLFTVADDQSGRMGTLRLDTVSIASEIFADSVHDQLLESADLFDPGDLSALADGARAHIVLIGSTLDFDDTMSAFFAEQIGSWIYQNGTDFGWDLGALANATRTESLDLSQSIYRSTVQTSGGGKIPIFDLVDFVDSNGHRDEFGRLMRLGITSDFAAPAGVGEDYDVHVSPDGSALALSWVDADTGAVHWTEGRQGSWSESKSLATSDAMDEAAIRELISAAIR